MRPAESGEKVPIVDGFTEPHPFEVQQRGHAVERFELAGEPKWLVNTTLHGLASLPLRVIPV